MRKYGKTLLAAGMLASLSAVVMAQQLTRSPAAAGARVYIIAPADGAVVSPTFTVEFGLAGMGVAPAGMPREGTGHHHLLVDGSQLPSLDMPLGTDVTHFGAGQTGTTLTLSPGVHTLQLIFADHLHLPHDPPVVSEEITITVSN